ncbi:hypothetical protein ASH00_15900 [Arthrobacter sp. Soil782]|uniref:hypothetical protein n=1 Tax=Arthrobacter sp. Soil782 TaxID=1736410 RepID=UPI0006F27743|nr:hypothetical protein [Arthrobacter sp. Soil782]KRF03268.1 hypothetical protein ASH00_15900 [Arthrobacter sp. Soil782]
MDIWGADTWTAIGTIALAVFTFLLAVFTLGLALLAYWAGRHARSAALETRSAALAAWRGVERQESRDFAAQAVRIYTSPVKMSGNLHRIEDPPGLEVVNGSDLPIYDVYVWITDQDSGNSSRFFERSLLPGERKPLQMSFSELTIQWGWIDHEGEHMPYLTLPEGAKSVSFTSFLKFRDCGNNQWWQRDKSGVLSTTTEPDD